MINSQIALSFDQVLTKQMIQSYGTHSLHTLASTSSGDSIICVKAYSMEMGSAVHVLPPASAPLANENDSTFGFIAALNDEGEVASLSGLRKGWHMLSCVMWEDRQVYYLDGKKLGSHKLERPWMNLATIGNVQEGGKNWGCFSTFCILQISLKDDEVAKRYEAKREELKQADNVSHLQDNGPQLSKLHKSAAPGSFPNSPDIEIIFGRDTNITINPPNSFFIQGLVFSEKKQRLAKSRHKQLSPACVAGPYPSDASGIGYARHSSAHSRATAFALSPAVEICQSEVSTDLDSVGWTISVWVKFPAYDVSTSGASGSPGHHALISGDLCCHVAVYSDCLALGVLEYDLTQTVSGRCRLLFDMRCILCIATDNVHVLTQNTCTFTIFCFLDMSK